MGKLKRVILHIGPEKTGTTTLQSFLSVSRDVLARLQVNYVSDEFGHNLNNANNAAVGFLGADLVPVTEWAVWDRTDTDWKRVRRALHTSSLPTAVMSGEAFSLYPDEAISRLKGELSGWEIHLVVTLRPLSQIIPSYWQERAKRRVVPSLGDFTEGLLDADSSDWESKRFRLTQRHDLLIKRWQELLQPTRTTAIVVSKEQPNNLLDGFSQVLGIDEQLLTTTYKLLSAEIRSNESFSQEQVSMLQSVHAELARREMLESSTNLVWRANSFFKGSTAQGNKITLQRRFAQDVALLERQIVDGLRQLDLSVVGAIELLAPPPPSATTPRDAEQDQLSQEALIATAGHMTVAMLRQAGLRPNGHVDLSLLAKKATLTHLWLLAIKSTLWAVVPLSMRARLRPFLHSSGISGGSTSHE